jgi:hypothetical protein
VTRTTVTCGRSGEPIEADRVKLVVETGKLNAGYADHAAGWPCIDLCETCAAALADWMNSALRSPG